MAGGFGPAAWANASTQTDGPCCTSRQLLEELQCDLALNRPQPHSLQTATANSSPAMEVAHLGLIGLAALQFSQLQRETPETRYRHRLPSPGRRAVSVPEPNLPPLHTPAQHSGNVKQEALMILSQLLQECEEVRIGNHSPSEHLLHRDEGQQCNTQLMDEPCKQPTISEGTSLQNVPGQAGEIAGPRTDYASDSNRVAVNTTSSSGSDLADSYNSLQSTAISIDGLYACPHCKKLLSSKIALQNHFTLHTGLRPHICAQCGQRFRLCGSLHSHERAVHRRELLQLCEHCGRRFCTPQELRLHTRTHTGERPFVCSHCGKRFVQACSLLSHERAVHLREHPHMCHSCGRAFAQRYALKKHMLTHSGERPHACAACGNRFATASLLRRHQITHTDERPFVCEVCHQSFRYHDSLTAHLHLHTGDRPYRCSDCGRGFTANNQLRKHQRLAHLYAPPRSS